MSIDGGSFYVGAGRPPLVLDTWEAVVIASGAGVLDETAWVEKKQDIPASSKPANKELARDLASLSLDGGVLLVGVADDGTVTGFTHDPEALRTRVVQLASTVISPPLFVEMTFLREPSAGSDATVAVIVVPASGSAPHMVEDKYWGRNSVGKRPLSDPEIDRVMTARRHRTQRVDEELRNLERELGPLCDDPTLGHLSFVAHPRGTTRKTLTDALGDRFLPQLLNEASDFGSTWAPWSFTHATSTFHPDGILVSSDDHRQGLTADEPWSYRLLLSQDGTVSGVSGGATCEISRERRSEATSAVDVGYLLEGVHRLVHLAGYVATEHLQFWGEWEIGVHVTGIRGLYASMRCKGRGFGYEMAPYPQDDYLYSTSSTTRLLQSSTPEVVDRLLTPLLRSLGVHRTYLPYERGEQIFERHQRQS